MEITQIADNLVLQADGIWRSKNQSPISYPEDGNKICFQVEERSFWFVHRNRCILKVVQRFPPSGVLFDIGGGNGFVSLALSSAGVQTVLVEPGERGVAYARNRGVRNIIHSTMEDAGFKEHSLAAVGMFDVLEHIQDDVMFLKMIRALMQPNGRLYLTIPAYQWLWSVVDDDSGHYRRYTAKLLRDVLSRSGFRIELVSYFFLPLVIPIYLFRALPSRLGSRKGGNIEGCQGELAPPSSLVNGFLAYFLGFETSILEKHQIPFGASCVVVAACN